MEEDTRAIVVDMGSAWIKGGLAGDEIPKSIFPDLVGRSTRGETYVGFEAQAKRGIVGLRYPIERGIVTNWDNVELLWRHLIYDNLHLAPEGTD